MKQKRSAIWILLILFVVLAGCEPELKNGIASVGTEVSLTEEDQVTVERSYYREGVFIVEITVSFETLTLESFTEIVLSKQESGTLNIGYDEARTKQMNEDVQATVPYRGTIYLAFRHETLHADVDMCGYQLQLLLVAEDGVGSTYRLYVQ